jgi:hypothetical protein
VLNRRAAVILALLATATLAGYAAGGVRTEAKWSGWTAASVAPGKAGRE